MILAILQARMSSTRLPGKVLKPLAGAPALERQLERVARAERIDRLIVATSDQPEDDAIAEISEALGIGCFRGDLDNVLDRFYRAAQALAPRHVVRLTGDCPLADWRLIDRLVETHVTGGYDYASTVMPRCYPKGLDAEIMTLAALETAWREAADPYQREHVTPLLYQPQHSSRFKLGSVSQAEDWSPLHWTLDRPEDYKMIAAVYQALYPQDPAFGTEDILDYLLAHPEVHALNADQRALAKYAELLGRR